MMPGLEDSRYDVPVRYSYRLVGSVFWRLSVKYRRKVVVGIKFLGLRHYTAEACGSFTSCVVD